MSDYLPPLTALRAFDAAARHMSFADAAAELHVTPAALSFQIKALEEHLGAPVFRRLNRAVELTELGKRLHPDIERGFDAIKNGWRVAQHDLNNSILTVTAGPAFTSKWLAPRLYDFAQHHPEIELRFAASLKMLDLHRDDVDVAIRFTSKESPPNLFCQDLMDEWVIPAMVPEIAAKIQSASNIGQATLIHDDSVRSIVGEPNWEDWFALAKVEMTSEGGPRFSQADHAVDFAMEGGGIVLGRLSMIERALHSGALVAPFGPAIFNRSSYRLLCRDGAQDRPAIKAFREWVTKEIQAAKALTSQFNPISMS
jgi:LysR family glycine cleavage system transcriptional activator